MSQAIRSFLLSILLCVCVAPVPAQDASREQMKGLDEQVQEVKSDVLSIAADLSQLEEKLLYPSNTHLAVFVALAQGACGGEKSRQASAVRASSQRDEMRRSSLCAGSLAGFSFSLD